VLAAAGARQSEVRDQPREHVRVAGQREVIDARVVGEAEVEAGHCLPGEDRFVGDVLLVHIAVTREDRRRVVEQLTGREVVQAEADDGSIPEPFSA
jgi:hypothetical protein